MKSFHLASIIDARPSGIPFFGLFLSLLANTTFAQFNTSIDFAPTVLWSMYTGGENYDDAKQVIADYGGSVYTTGMISDGSQIADLAFLNSYGGGLSDAYVTKTSPEGVVLWSRFIGGASSDFGTSLCELPDGNILVGGYTSSIAEIAIDGAQQTYGGGISDGFVALIDPSGNFISSSYIGGSGRDVITKLACNQSGRIFISGNTNSSSLPYTMEYQTSYGGGTSDGLIAEIMLTGEVVWAAYVGGTFADYVNDIEVAPNGDLHFCGRGGPSEFISTMDSPILGGGISDGFVGVLQNEGLAWAKYIGGTNFDGFESVGIAPSGATIVAGSTNSNAITGLDTETGIVNNNYDIMLVAFTPEGDVLWHHFIGGSENDTPAAIDVDLMGNILMGANTESVDMEVINPVFENLVGGTDMFMARWNINGTLIWSSYMGGVDDDFCTDIFVDRFGKIVYSGYTESDALYGTAQESSYGGGWDGVVSRIADCENPEVEMHALSDTTLCEGGSAEFCAGGAPHYLWFNLDTLAITDTQEPGYVYTIGIRENGCIGVSNRIMVTILERPEVEAIAFGPTVFCGTGEVYMEATGAPILAWNNGDEGYFTTITEAGVYYATGTAENGCRDTSPGIEVIFVEEPEMTLAIGNSDLCIEGGTEALIALPEGGTFAGTGVVDNTFDPLMAGGGSHEVYYQFEDEYGCFSNSDTLTINVYYPPILIFDALDTLCLTDAPVDLLGLPVGGFFSGDGIMGNSFNPSMSGTGPQNITYTYFDQYGCVNNANQIITVDACIGIDELNDESLFFLSYPNPADANISLRFKPHVKYVCSLVAPSGQLVKQWTCSDFYQLDVSEWANGMYYLRIESTDWNFTQKMQIAH
jgi:hypothetical protein